MITEIKVGQVWKHKSSGDTVKVLSVGSDFAKVQDREGSDVGTTKSIKKVLFPRDYILIKNV